jgi:putative tricarboxylic transport membrane protein
MRRNDIHSSLVWLLVGMGFIWGGLKMGIGPLDSPGPGFFPTMIGGVFSLLSLALFITASWSENQLPIKVSFWKEEKSWIKVFLSLFSLVFYLIALNYLGYILTTFLFILYLLKIVGKRGWGGSLLIAFIVSLGSFAVFKTALGVLLPRGLINLG